MTTTAQQPPSNPALDFANSILEVTNNGLELIEILRDIAEDDQNATTNDRIAASRILLDRGLGKCPKQSQTPPTESERDPESAESDEHTNHSSDTPHSPRLVTQIDDTLNQSIGPAPSAHSPKSVGAGLVPAQPAFDPNSIHFTIQQHILDITNNGQTLRDILLEIARTKDNLRITPYHRRRSVTLLLDRALGTDSTPVFRALQERPEPVLSDSDYPDYPPGYVFDPIKDCIYWSQSIALPEGHEGEHLFDHEGLAKAFEDIQRKLDEQGIALDPNPPGIDYHISMPSKEWVANNIDLVREEAAKFREENRLRIERRKNWPKIEERRRKKLAQIYPSHSDDDGEPPDT